MKTKSNTGKKAKFHNLHAYPSLHGKTCVIVSDHGPSEQYRYGIQFDGDNKSMAATESELTIQGD